MLTRKQLAGMVKCRTTSCHNCDVLGDCLDTRVMGALAAQTALTLVDMLKQTTDALNDAVIKMRRYNIDTYIEKSHIVVNAQAMLKDLEG